ncbi:MAG: hypothetical protein CVV05_08995 [Gammaproteobacteria bacterium HGW-Gammaproteobacteria-1]|jgi:hypothetical protein|nr:MAG: hypothetical protein CVV05_08995 [Gammaproteobacteria bacterium HGW-Gammaproteobacteria-1]
MPQLPYSIELHDSDVSAIESPEGKGIVRFSHAYIHNEGKGWSQAAELRVGSAVIESNQATYPARVWDGNLNTKGGAYHNLLTLPIDADGDVELVIEFSSGAVARIKGSGVSLVFTGERAFIEDVT